jgi:hypothetical protein
MDASLDDIPAAPGKTGDDRSIAEKPAEHLTYAVPPCRRNGVIATPQPFDVVWNRDEHRRAIHVTACRRSVRVG